MKKIKKEHTEQKRRNLSIQEFKRLYHETLKGRITISVLTLVILPLLVLGVVSSVLNSHSTNSTLEQNMKATAQVTSERVEWELASYLNIAEDLGVMTRLSREDVPLEEKQEVLDERVAAQGLTRGNILTAEGISIFSGEDFSDRDYFKTAMGGKSCVSEPLVSKTTGKVSVVIAAPIWEGGILGTKVIGVVYIVPEETFLNDIMLSINVSDNGSAYMINKEGAVIAHEDMDLVAKKENSIKDAESDSRLKALAKLENKMIAGEIGFGSYRYGGGKKIMAFAPVNNTDGWSVAITAPKSDFIFETIVGIIITIVIVLAAIILAISIVRKLADRISIPIQLCAGRLVELAKGDLHTEIPQIDSQDETKSLADATRVIVKEMGEMITDVKYLLGEMADNNFNVKTRARDSYIGDFEEILLAVRRINRSLSSTLGHIRESADQVGLGSNQMAESGQALAEGATDQAASIEELLATVNNLAEQVEYNTRTAVSTSQKADDIGKQAVASNQHIMEMTEAMGKISAASMQIANIIQTIEEIADQTNLLSLNASIEAARAGEAGKGFAVVANEIRELASKSAEAVNQASELIETSQNAVENGIGIADNTAKSLVAVVEGSEEILNSMDKISHASQNQKSALERLTEHVDSISKVVQSNSSSAQSSASTSAELSSQSKCLHELVNRFHLKQTEQSGQAHFSSPTPHS